MDHMVEVGELPEELEREDGGMRIGAGASARFWVPGVDGAEFLIISYHTVARGIERGEHRWEDGRLMLEWWLNGECVGHSPIRSAVGDDGFEEEMCVQRAAFQAPHAGAVPILRFEHLGVAGIYEMTVLQMVAARERALWRVGKWCLLMGWVLVIGMMLGGKSRYRWFGSMIAAGIWVWVAVAYAFPGPWDSARPFAMDFAFPGVPEFSAAVDAKRGGIDEAAWLVDEGVGQLQPNDIGLKLKLLGLWIRPFLHFALLFAPVLAMAWFVNGKAFWLGWALSLTIEGSQVLYGFGFGWDDVWDLLVNGFSISAGMWVHREWSSKFRFWWHSTR